MPQHNINIEYKSMATHQVIQITCEANPIKGAYHTLFP